MNIRTPVNLSLSTLAVLQNKALSWALHDKTVPWTPRAACSFTTDVGTVSMVHGSCNGLGTQQEDKTDLALSSHHYVFNKQANKNT